MLRIVISGDRLVAAGGVVAGLGGALGVGYFIYALQSSVTFWSWPGWVAVCATLTGLAIVAIGILRRDAPKAAQHQRGGNSSTNYQAGRDLTVKREDGDH